MKKILIFNDISGLGNCSMVANLPIFTRLGHYCMPLITANYSCQTGFDGFIYQRNGNVADFARNLTDNRHPDAIYVGFCNDKDILEGVTRFVGDFSGDDVYLLVDPIMGDNGKMYPVFDGEYLNAMKRILSYADCATPNLTEACLLADVDYFKLISHKDEPTFLATCGEVFADFLRKTGCKSAVITGIECGKYIGNIVFSGDSVRYVTNERVEITYSGTGDVFSSVVLGELLCGYSLFASTQAAANFVGKAASLTECKDRRFGVDFAKVLHLL